MVESVFGIILILVLALGTIQVAFTLYARNVVMSAVHDAARAAVEVAGPGLDADIVAARTVQRSARGLVDDLYVTTVTRQSEARYHVRVIATASLNVPGPVPGDLPIRVEASSSREVFHTDG